MITITGNNSLLMSEELNKLVNDFIKKYGELAVERIDGEDAELNAILDAVQSLPFLSEKKLVVVKNLGSNKTVVEDIEQIISSTSTPVAVIFYEPKPDKRTAFYKTLKAKTDFKEFAELDARSLPRWLVEVAKSQDAKLSLADATHLVERVGANQQLLAGELDKLITFNPEISRTSIELLSEKTPQSKVFDLLDAAFSGQKKRALELYEEQRLQRVEPQEILAMLAWQLRLISYAKLAGNASSDQIAKDAAASPFPVARAQRLASKLELSKLRQMVDEAQKIDSASKTLPLDLDEALKNYIVAVL